MNILIVHAHPEAKSFCAALKNTAVSELTAQGHNVEVSDLYALNFNPVADKNDFIALKNPDYFNYALEQRHAVENNLLSPQIQTELEKLQRCDLLLLNFPLYWFSVPAILKGWIDKVFVSGKIYGGRRIYNKAGLVGKKAAICLTLGGQEQMFNANDGIHGDINILLKPLIQGALGYVGFDVLKPFIAWHVPYISDEQRQKILEVWKNRLKNITTENKLYTFPNLDNYDKSLRKIKKENK